MKATLKPTGVVTANCPECGSVSNFEPKSGVSITGFHHFYEKRYTRILLSLLQCSGCLKGGLARIHDDGDVKNGVLESFFPYPQVHAPLPVSVPQDIEAEFREAETCFSVEANRAATALLRSTLEKTLKVNGYQNTNVAGFDKMSLKNKIDEAAKDGIITESLRNRAHDEIRVLGNDVMHDNWVKISSEDVEVAHHYTQRILECFYDHRSSVEKILIAKKRISAQADSI